MNRLCGCARFFPILAFACWATWPFGFALGQQPPPEEQQTAPADRPLDEQPPSEGSKAAIQGQPGTLPVDQTRPASEESQPSAFELPPERLNWHIPDPEKDRGRIIAALERARQNNDRAGQTYITRVLARVEEIRRPQQLELTLEEAIIRALANNYGIRVASYNPAVETTRIVEAEAAFDAAFFTNITKNNIDRPSGSQLTATDLDLFTSEYGVRKMLPSGAQVSMSYALNRQKSALSFQQINPEYTSNFFLEARQPLLRGFGIDFNRAFIVVAKNDKRISDYAFQRQVRETIRLVEELYWRLVQARRDVTITSRIIADFEVIYDYLEARQEFDITPVQLAATRANLEQSRTEFILREADVYDAEDRLVAAMNSDDIDLADNIEIIPTDVPRLDPLLVDRLAEVQTALDYRQEIHEQELRVSNAKVAVGRAANLELPRFDLSFRTTYDGLGISADDSFDQLTQGDFIEYFVGVEFEYPIGNRGARAASRRSRLQQQQQVAELKRVIEEVILDTNLAVRRISTAYDAIAPSFESAEAREREVDSIVARAERKDFVVLNQELGARQSLAAARRTMLSAMVEYNIAIVDLERAKGTLLQYYNVIIPDDATSFPGQPLISAPD